MKSVFTDYKTTKYRVNQILMFGPPATLCFYNLPGVWPHNEGLLTSGRPGVQACDLSSRVAEVSRSQVQALSELYKEFKANLVRHCLKTPSEKRAVVAAQCNGAA